MSDSAPDGEAERGELLETAAHWLLRILKDDDPNTRRNLDIWLAASPANAEAYAEVRAAMELTRRYSDDAGMLQFRQDALDRMAGQRRTRRRYAIAVAIAIVLAIPAGWIAYSQLTMPTPQIAAAYPVTRYRTNVGQNRVVTLPDGSTVTLDTDSAMQVAFSASERRIVLDRGQASFKVASDRQRAFTVVSGDRQVVAHGTEFDVRLDPGRVTVALLEGAVSVAPIAGGRGSPVRLQPNEVLTADGNNVAVHHGNVRDLMSWRDGLLIFENRDLRSAAREMGRYDKVRVEFADQRAAQMRISGSFHAGETRAFAEALVDILPLAIANQTQNRIVLKAI